MTNPLTTLDEIIWKQFEKVTNAAYNRQGWDKWDLARTSDALASASFLGVGIYTLNVAMSFSEPSTVFPVIGSFLTLLAPFYFYSQKYRCEKKREEEAKELIQTGAVREPKLIPYRPLGFGLTVISILTGDHLLELSEEFRLRTMAVTGILVGITYAGITSASYFKSQLPRPPSAKKSLWQVLNEYVSKPFHQGLPKPAEQPVVKYNSSPEPCRT